MSPVSLLIGAPQALINLLSLHTYTWSLRYHYAATPLIAATIAMVEGVARLRRPGLRRFLVGLVAACALATSAAWGISPVSAHYREGFWPLQDNPRQLAMEAAVLAPGGDDSVAATYAFVPHLTHRRNIYTFPNPWQSSNWGIRGENQHDPDTVDWLIIDRTLLGADASVLLDGILATGDWEIQSTSDDILIAHRAE